MTAEAFYKELKRLIHLEPRPAAHVLNSEKCEYGEHIYYSKNLYFAFDCLKCVDSSFIYDSVMQTNSIDVDYGFESQLCYESVDVHKCFNSAFLENCSNVHDSFYSSKCIDCHDIFGSVLLRNKSYCIFNRQLTQEQYKVEVEKYKKWPPQKVFAAVEQLKKIYPLTQTNEAHNENSSYGDYVYYNKNCFLCFDASYCENSGYIYDSINNKNSYDVTYSTENELCYEVVDSGQNFNSSYVVYSAHCHDGLYMINCFDVKNSLGCVGLSHKQYCILNRQFTKSEYEKISEPLLSELRTKNLGWDALNISSSILTS